MSLLLTKFKVNISVILTPLFRSILTHPLHGGFHG